MGLFIMLFIMLVLGCGILIQSKNNNVKNFGIVLGLIGLIFCMCIGYKLGGITGTVIGLFIMAFIVGKGIQEKDKVDANEYLANKNREGK